MKLEWQKILEVLEAVEADRYDEVASEKDYESSKELCLNMYLCMDAGYVEPFIFEYKDEETGKTVIEDPVPRLTWEGYKALYELRGDDPLKDV